MGDKEKAQPAIAQLVEHLTVERCRNQMVPGSIPGGRIFDMQHLYRIIQPATTEIQLKISYGLLGSPSGSKRARELKSMPKAHCLGGVVTCRNCSLEFVHTILKKQERGLCASWITTKTLPGRLELPTLRLTASRSNQLS